MFIRQEFIVKLNYHARNRSKIFIVLLEVSANRTSQRLLLPVTVVVTPHWTLTRALAFRQLILSVLAHVVSIALPLVARLTEVSITPTEPL